MRLKIAFVAQPWEPVPTPNVKGSIVLWTTEVARRLARDHEVTIYARQHGDAPTHEIYDGVEIRRVSMTIDRRLMPKLERYWSRFRPSDPLFASRWYYPMYIRSVCRALVGKPAEIVHLHNMTQYLQPLRRAFPEARILLHMHSEWLTQIDGETVAARLAHLDSIVTCSDYLAGLVRERFPEAPVTAIPNGVDASRYTECRATRARRLLFVGRISPEKGIHDLVDAFIKLARDDSALELKLIGPEGAAPREFMVDCSNDPHVQKLALFYDGRAYRTHLEERIPDDLRSRVEFAGFVRQEDLPREYAEAAVLVNPSLTESFGMSLIEALATGTPVVATRIGGMPGVLEGAGVGTLVDPADSDQLAEAIGARLAEPPREESERGRAYVCDHFDWDRVAERTEAHYCAVRGEKIHA